MSIEKDLERLRREIRQHDYKYYVKAEPDISDQEYDLLYKKLEELEKKYPHLITADSPTQRVSGQPTKEFETVRHRFPMLSLSNTYSESELKDFDRRVQEILGDTENYSYVAELKIDGLAVSLVYENGVFSRGATRGDGILGDDVSVNLRTIRSLPLRIDGKKEVPRAFEVRGEVYLSAEQFREINAIRAERNEPLFANPRNSAAGTLKMQDARIVAERGLSLFVYQFIDYSEENQMSTHIMNLKHLEEFRFPVNPHTSLCRNMDEVLRYCHNWEQKRKNLSYEIDGVVIKINDLRQREIMGATSKSPRWAISFKFKAQQAETMINKITWQVGRTGIVTPVAELTPVSLAGTVVSRATLHNPDEIERKDIREGDAVLVEKGGDIIPKVISVLFDKRSANSRPYKIPEECPVCGSKLYRNEDEAAMRCLNITCPEQIVRRIQHFASRSAMDIEGLGSAIVELFVQKGLIENIADLYYLKKDQINVLAGLGEKSAENLINSIAQSKKQELDRLIFGLGIPFIGETAARTIASTFHQLDTFMKSDRSMLEEIDGIGSKMAESIVTFFHNTSNTKTIDKLREAGVNFTYQSENISKRLDGLTFVITGTLPNMSRQQATELITANGGKVTSSVSSQTDYLLVGENPGSKLDKAHNLKIKIINEDELKKIISL